MSLFSYNAWNHVRLEVSGSLCVKYYVSTFACLTLTSFADFLLLHFWKAYEPQNNRVVLVFKTCSCRDALMV